MGGLHIQGLVMKKITILGAGLAGSLLAIYLAKRGYEVEIFESRPDLRLGPIDSGRSINLALSCRGITGLASAGLLSSVKQFMVPMRARAIHQEAGEIRYQAFGRHKDEYINAIQRSDLNTLLLNQLEQFKYVHLHFDRRLLELDVFKKNLHFELPDKSVLIKPYHRLIAADGASSQVRETLKHNQLIKASRAYLDHGYKELSISAGGKNAMAPEHLHLWPRDSFLLLGNPNLDASITGSLFLAHEGRNSFQELDNELSVNQFFKQAFPDAYPNMPNLIPEFLEHPTGLMSTIRSEPWSFEDSCLMIGDAAHGLVPFFGQGMNSAFEDCRILDGLLQEYEDNWSKVIPLFYALRKPNTEAVAQMSLDNYQEIQKAIRSENFNFKKELEQALMQRYPNRYISKHVLVMFSNTPYAKAYAIGELQRHLLEEIAKTFQKIQAIDWEFVEKLMENYDKKLAKLEVS